MSIKEVICVGIVIGLIVADGALEREQRRRQRAFNVAVTAAVKRLAERTTDCQCHVDEPLTAADLAGACNR